MARHVYMQTNETQNHIMHFGLNAYGQLELLESIPTGGAGSGIFKPISGQASAPNAFEGAGSVTLAESNTLLFSTSGGDNSVTTFRVSPDGKLTVFDRQTTGEPVTVVNTTTKTDRVSTQAVLAPDGRFLLVDILFDTRPAANPDGSPNLVVANAPDPDGLVIFPVHDDGTLGQASIADAGGAGPFYIAFLNQSCDTFLNGSR